VSGTIRQTLRRASVGELRERLKAGAAIDPRALEGWAFRGTVLGAPALVERLTWATFQKAFHREPDTGRLVGWNVRLHQDGLDAPSRPLERGGVPVTTWPYEVFEGSALAPPPLAPAGLVIDYAAGAQGVRGPMRLVKDPLVALTPGSADVLLGVSCLVAGGRWLETPTYFLLEREHPLTFVPPPPLPLRAFERRWATQWFDAIIGDPPGAPPLLAAEPAAFWSALRRRAPGHVTLGLRAAVLALTFLPLTMPGFRRPFFALPRPQRLACAQAAADHPSLAVRQALATVKLLACIAWLERPDARAAFAPTRARTAPAT
jgi:hypothetical protein